MPNFDDARRNSPLLQAAFELARRGHDGQFRKHGPPYIEHPVAVAKRLWELSGAMDEELVAAAFLHDTLEDTEVTRGEIATACGARVLRLVEAVTRSKTMPKPEYLAHLKDAPADVKALKVADRTENLRDVVGLGDVAFAKRYAEETEQFLLRLADEVPAGLGRGLREALENAKALSQSVIAR